jgi:hypothetical protein
MSEENIVAIQEEIEGELLERLGFCGCGMPNAALILIHELLIYIEERWSTHYNGPFQGPEWESHCKSDKDAIKHVIERNYDGICYVLFYLLDHKRITSHGGSVPGWIEDDDFRDKLKNYIEYIKKD